MATVKEPTIQTLDVYIGRHLIEVEYEPELGCFGDREVLLGFAIYDMWLVNLKASTRRRRNISGYISNETKLDILEKFNERHVSTNARKYNDDYQF
jgi:hypothetical protein